MDPIRRFSSKALVYARYRPNFAPQAIETLKATIGLPYEAAVVDIGSGTGMLTRQLLTHFAIVYALEPNPEMRAVAAVELSGFPRFFLLAAQAEAIPLMAGSIDLITAGRVVHWLQPEPTRTEFRRIAKPGAWLAIARLRMVDERFLEAMRTLRKPAYGFRTPEEDPQPGDVPVEFYFVDKQYQTLTFLQKHQQTFDAFVGGLQSGSYAPDQNHPRYKDFSQAAQDIFRQLSDDDTMTLQISTEIHFGVVK